MPSFDPLAHNRHDLAPRCNKTMNTSILAAFHQARQVRTFPDTGLGTWSYYVTKASEPSEVSRTPEEHCGSARHCETTVVFRGKVVSRFSGPRAIARLTPNSLRGYTQQ